MVVGPAVVVPVVVAGADVVVGPGEVEVVVVPGEAWACAGTMTAFTIGRTHFSGSANIASAPPPKAMRNRLRRSSFMAVPHAGRGD